MISIHRIIINTLATLGIGSDGSNSSALPQLAQIRKLPIGLQVTHSPNPVRAVREGRSGCNFTWTYSTTVTAVDKALKIVEFGAFMEQGGRWVFANFTGQPFTAQDFAEWYSCASGTVRLGAEATDSQNWSGASQLRPSRGLWYFIGVDDAGNRYRGEAVIEQLAAMASG